MREQEENILSAAQEIWNDYKFYGEVLQTDDDGEYGTESAIGRLVAAIKECQYIKPDPKPLAEYLTEYINQEIQEHQQWVSVLPKEWIQQALDACENTENITIIIERNV